MFQCKILKILGISLKYTDDFGDINICWAVLRLVPPNKIFDINTILLKTLNKYLAFIYTCIIFKWIIVFYTQILIDHL